MIFFEILLIPKERSDMVLLGFSYHLMLIELLSSFVPNTENSKMKCLFSRFDFNSYHNQLLMN